MNRPQNAAQIAASIDQASLPSTQAAPTRPMAVDPGTRQVLDDLFVRLKGIFPGWRASWPTAAEEGAAKREWLAMFVGAGINRIEQIQHGVRMAREYSRGGDKERGYLPTPGMFVKWCHAPEAFGLPPLERAYAQAMRNTHVAQAADARWSHAALYHAAKACGYSNLQSLKRADGLKLFDKHYSAVCQRLARGEVLEPAPIAALPAPLKKGSAAVANAALAALRSKLGGCARG